MADPMSDAVFAAAFKRMMGASGIPAGLKPLIKLKKQEDFLTWKNDLIRTLRKEEFEKYILEDVPRPDDEEARKKWRYDRGEIDDLIRASIVDTKVWSNLTGMGWDGSDSDPKKTYDKLCQYFQNTVSDGPYDDLQEYVAIRCGKFDKMDSYQARLNYLRQQIDACKDITLTDTGHLWMAVRGIEQEYPELYHRMAAGIENKTLTWADLMTEFQRMAVKQNKLPVMSSVTTKPVDKPTTRWTDKPTDGTKTREASRPADGKARGPCTTCGKIVYMNSKHCHACGNHHKGDVCWWCNPEKAPDNWVKKEAAMANKRGQQHSTTGPLHQQTGNARPSVLAPRPRSILKDNTKPASLLFQTNIEEYDNDHDNGYDSAMTSINVNPPFFRQGPQRK
jgi:hypothetical protein